jgi:hypothetical protein
MEDSACDLLEQARIAATLNATGTFRGQTLKKSFFALQIPDGKQSIPNHMYNIAIKVLKSVMVY